MDYFYFLDGSMMVMDITSSLVTQFIDVGRNDIMSLSYS